MAAGGQSGGQGWRVAGAAVLAAACLLLVVVGQQGSVGVQELVQSEDRSSLKDAVGVMKLDHQVVVHDAVQLERRIQKLALALKRQKDVLKGASQVAPSSVRGIKKDVEEIDYRWQQFQNAENVPKIAAAKPLPESKASKRWENRQRDLQAKAKAALKQARQEVEESQKMKVSAKSDEQTYKDKLVAAAKAHNKLVKARAELKELRKQKAIQLQLKEQTAIKQAESQVKTDKQRKEQAKLKRQRDKNLESWGRAAAAAERGDAKTVGEFCAKQADPAACRSSLLDTTVDSGKKNPCDPAASGYLKCLGVRATGATMSSSWDGISLRGRDLDRLVGDRGRKIVADQAEKQRRARDDQLVDKAWD